MVLTWSSLLTIEEKSWKYLRFRGSVILFLFPFSSFVFSLHIRWPRNDKESTKLILDHKGQTWFEQMRVGWYPIGWRQYWQIHMLRNWRAIKLSLLLELIISVQYNLRFFPFYLYLLKKYCICIIKWQNVSCFWHSTLFRLPFGLVQKTILGHWPKWTV